MTMLAFTIPIALLLGGLGVAAFLWSLRSGQYEDLDGAAVRILTDEDRQADRETGLEAAPSTPQQQ